MLTILFIICGLRFWVIASNNSTSLENVFVPKCYPLIQCDDYFSVAGFVEVNWLEANYICNRVGSVLATVRNEEHHQLMIDYLIKNEKIFGRKTFWLGATNQVKRTYFWTWLSTGIPVTYGQWASKEPKSDRTGQDACMVLGTDNLWHSDSCNEKHYFICENICQLNYTSLDKRVYI
ncbi:snaclec coagulation factor IX/factor X-binding protein subunit B [Drosophila rhopaloa]|uniref:Snaclec coagulation factor IX/factor X-binding protein subunit B n=1 Tax=Drosophila rhopaloa TaxID=1041015 RepID=A0A6P4FIG6_DRORH|nr:snaclec coagulation factor IX/factor X-binding protein subunit B [Drosophila rhopaloa]